MCGIVAGTQSYIGASDSSIASRKAMPRALSGSWAGLGATVRVRCQMPERFGAACAWSEEWPGASRTAAPRAAAANVERKEIMMPPSELLPVFLADGVMPGPGARVVGVPVAGIAGDLLVRHAVRARVDVGRRAVGIGARAVDHPVGVALRHPEPRV